MVTQFFSLCLLSIYFTKAAEITGWIYVDNWFELYFNGVKVATDPIKFKPHNGVRVSFTAPDTGLYSFALWAQDYADDVTGLESRNGGTCLGDGGIRIKLSDGTISSSDWKCFITMQGPENTECVINNECTNTPSVCTVTYNDYPSCWNETTCVAADSWSSATEYDNVDGWGVPTDCTNADNCLCCGCGDNDDCTSVQNPTIDASCFNSEYPNGCSPSQQNWGDSKFIWTSDLNIHNRIICRYEYCVGGGTDCTAEATPTTLEPSRSPLVSGQTHAPTMTPTTDDTKGSNGSGRLYVLIACVVMLISIIVV